MSLELIQKIEILNPTLEQFIAEKIGDGTKDVFIGADSYLKEIISDNTLDISSSLKLGECEIDGVKAIRKLGFVYLSDSNGRGQRILSVVPALQYSKDGKEIMSIGHINVYYQYNLIVNANKYDLAVVSYTLAL